VVSVLALAVRLRLGGAPAYAQSWAWGAAARRVALVVLLVHAVWSVLDVGLTAWFSVAVPASSAPPDPTDAPSLGEWVLTLAGLVWLAAYLALLAGRPHVAGGLAAVGLAQVAVLRVQNVLLTHAPIVAAAAAAVSVVVPALLLLGLAAFHRDAPLPRRRPWLTALGVGLVVGSALAVLVIRTADAGPAVWVFLHRGRWDGVSRASGSPSGRRARLASCPRGACRGRADAAPHLAVGTPRGGLARL
jgi:hypothetical protein